MSFHFVLKRSGWGYDDLYEAIKVGEKTSEWRDASDHWVRRLLNEEGLSLLEAFNSGYENLDELSFLPYYWKHIQARFVVGYTKSPMLVADVTGIIYHRDTEQFEVQIKNVAECSSPPINKRRRRE